jgi:single-strand DNA-binding protein
MSVNKCIFLGHVGKDPEVKTVGDNKVATFSMAMTDKGYKTRDGKEIPDRTEWVNIVAWRGLASICEGYVKKGSMLYVEGRLTTRSYEKDGTKFYVTEVVAENIQLCGGKQEGASQGSKGSSAGIKGSSAGSKPEQYASAPQTDDDLPF